MSETIQFINAENDTIELTDLVNYAVLRGRIGDLMPVFTRSEEKVPLQAGSRLLRINTEPRELDIPLMIWDSSAVAMEARLRSLVQAMDPNLGEGKLRYTSQSGTSVDLNCRYVDGLRGDNRRANLTWRELVLTLRASDPYWYATSPVSATYETEEATATFFPFFPLVLSDSSVFADAAVNNSGDVDAWPVWTINGPGSNPVLRNLTTGKTLTLTYTITAGQTITIDTRPGYKTIELDTGDNLFPYRSNASSLWPLQRGSNTIRIELSSADENSSVVLSYYPRYLSPPS